jgi:hypothetical protein
MGSEFYGGRQVSTIGQGFRNGPRWRRRWRWIPVALVVVAIVAGVIAYKALGINSWTGHIGGRDTPGGTWQGVGTVSASNGGRYVLYISFTAHVAEDENGYACGQGGDIGCAEIIGSAKLCTLSGVTRDLEVDGEVDAFGRSTDGKQTVVVLNRRTPTGPSGVARFTGKWHGTELPLTDADEFTTAITKNGDFLETASSSNAGTASTTLRYGTEADFTRACHALTA